MPALNSLMATWYPPEERAKFGPLIYGGGLLLWHRGMSDIISKIVHNFYISIMTYFLLLHQA